ncbi:hypothetical protein ACGFJ7_40760 [Actinoplanes sp. NPDC048988]|uniref:hypothetical protein n=1 Tax=Actinoplanes sp. NPDC048988 TaxID=3363901 RepID=UPI00371CDA2E
MAPDGGERERWLTGSVVVIGGGFAGVETAAAIAERFARDGREHGAERVGASTAFR